MNNILENGKNFKIIPEKFEASTSFELKNVSETNFIATLKELNKEDLDSYNIGDPVEVFASSNEGLIYFKTDIISKDGSDLVLEIPKGHKNIQRREYSRVAPNCQLNLLNNPSAKNTPLDISAGGIRFKTDENLDEDKTHNVVINLPNNLDINCEICIIRKNSKGSNFVISARFINIKSIDRIALVQYTFKILTEEENKK